MRIETASTKTTCDDKLVSIFQINVFSIKRNTFEAMFPGIVVYVKNKRSGMFLPS